jgi:methionyl-tRNA synthetase
MIGIEDLAKLELRIGKIVKVADHPDASKLYVLQVDIGATQVQLVAGLKAYYSPQDLEGKSIVVVVNLEPKTVRGVTSYGMLLAAQSEDRVVILTPEKNIPPGSLIR